MSLLSNAVANYTERYVRRKRQVRVATFVKPRGLKRGIVTMGTCGQTVNGDRLSNIEPGAGVLVASDGGRNVILSSPAQPGLSSSAPLRLAGTPAALIDDPPGMPGPERRGVFVSNSDPRNLYVVRFVANVPTEAEVTLEQPADVDFAYAWVGTGNGRAIAFCSSGDGGGFPMEDVLAEVDLLTLNINSTYTMPRPSTDVDPGGTNWNMSPPSIKDGSVYWVEIQPDNTAQTHTYQLMRAPFGFLSTTSIVRSLTVANTDLEPANDISDVTMDDSFWKVWFAGDRWIWQGQVKAYNALGANPLETRRVEFLPSPLLVPPVTGDGTLTSYPRDGNLGGIDPTAGSDLIAARLGDDNLLTSVWPDTATIVSTDQFGNTYTGSALGAGNMTTYRGDITDPTPTLDVATYDSPATLIGEFAAPKIGIFTGA